MTTQPDGNYLFMFGTLPIPAIIHKGITYVSLVIISNLLRNFDFMPDVGGKLIITIADVRETSIKWHYGIRGRFIQIEEALKVMKKYLKSTIDRRSLVRISKQCSNSISKSLGFKKLDYNIPEHMSNLLPIDEISFNNDNPNTTIDLEASDELSSDVTSEANRNELQVTAPISSTSNEKRKRDEDENDLPPPKRHKALEEPSYKLYRTEIMGIPNLVVKYKGELYLSNTMINVCMGFHYRSDSGLKFTNSVPKYGQASISSRNRDFHISK